jgi:hypothetical protein
VDELTSRELRRVIVVYTSALLPLAIVVVQQLRGRLPRWLGAVYGATFLICAVGWEIWFSYGLAGGADVDARRSAALNAAIPQHLNWLLNSLADAGSIGLVGLFFVWLAHGKRDDAFRAWHWSAVAVLLAWFVAQNVFVELVIYHEQLALGHALSWAPLAPTGPRWNPVLFTLGGRTARLHTQLPWLLMTPIFYALALSCHRRFADPPARTTRSPR